MTGIKVCRGNSFPGQCKVSGDSALSWGDDISSVLLVNEDVAKERGRVEVDSTYSNRVESSITLAVRKFIAPGSLVGINDGGTERTGLLKSVTLSVSKDKDKFQTSTNMVLEGNV